MIRPVYELKAEFFRTLGHPARIRILEILRDGEANVADIAEAVGVSGSTLSQHLATLRHADVITSRREGPQVIYRVVDPRIFELLQVGREILTTTLEGSRELIDDLAQLRLQPRDDERAAG
jgi:DNA-binding transcriptional ArsR family regulator